jgi:DNA-binding NarL/FixJ family response regulator
MQYASVYQQELLGILTLFRTEKDGPFTNEDMFYLQAIGMHLNAVLYQITHSLPQTNDLKQTLARLKNTCHLTNRELQIAEQIYQYRNNDEIAGSLGIRENTLQKHLQNIFRKTNVTSRWELLRFRMR